MERRAPSEVIAEAERQGIDLSMLRERLRLPPTERLERNQAALEVVEALRGAKRKGEVCFSESLSALILLETR